MHMAACFPSIPVISLWGLFHPHDRVAYYPNHYAMFNFSTCKVAPCHNHQFELPLHNCVKATNWKESSDYCAALCAITPDQILEKAMEVIEK